ncbi:LPXTG cell wall anchor domain-containing protein [Actinacidiphila glaucinigra]|uniref:LAETG motif-containing sortase-dependent surface protein n=1 Tax=Actinacidiphila glaucinigra TaxID=235986 RepID=UPI00309236D4|nr:LPXTG cell wall anchor domain-containing protein [Actinacidiphila glaucinigra]
MTASPRRAWSRTGTLIATAATGIIGLGLCATPASAHTPVWDVTCTKVKVDLTQYGRGDNTVTITVDGKDLLPTETFKDQFHTELPLPAHTTEVQVRLVVKAADGANYSRDETKNAPACEDSGETTPTPTPTPTETKTTESPKPSETPSEEASTAPSAAPSTPSTDESPAGDLAETGASSSTPLLAGGAAVALLAGGGLLFANRKRRAAARH